MKKLWLTAIAILGIWVTFSVLRMILSFNSPWHIVIAGLFLLVCAYGTYKAIRSAYHEWKK